MPVRRAAGRLLVLGRHSFIARHFLAVCDQPVTAISHDAIDRPDLLDGIDRVISFTRHPQLVTSCQPSLPYGHSGVEGSAGQVGLNVGYA